MSKVGIQELLEAGVHFGHQTSRWNPNMRRYIAGELDGIHIIDLLQTEEMLEDARKFVGELTTGGGKVLFVGTKKQASDVIQNWAEKSNMPYVNRRWLPGLLTNFNISSARIKRLHERHAVVVVTPQLLGPAHEQRADEVVRQRLERIAHDRRVVLPVDQDDGPLAHVDRTSSSIFAVYFSYVFVSVENWMIRSCSWNG